MRILYEVADTRYWLEPVYKVVSNRLITISEVLLFSEDDRFIGTWHWTDIPGQTRLHIRAEIRAYEKAKTKAERLERVRTRSMISKTK